MHFGKRKDGEMVRQGVQNGTRIKLGRRSTLTGDNIYIYIGVVRSLIANQEAKH